MKKLDVIQKYLNDNNIDAWVVYQFIDINPIFNKLIETDKKVVTRRTFLIIPQSGDITLLHSNVDGGFEDLGFKEVTYTSYDEFKTVSQNELSKYKKVAMEYSPMAAIPHISKVDAGIIDWVRSCGVEVVSSGDLMQYTSTLTEDEVKSHLEAAEKLDAIRRDTFSYIEDSIKNNMEVTEYSIKHFISTKIEQQGLESVYEPQTVFNENSARTHYSPPEVGSKVLKDGDVILIDMWLKNKDPKAIYADITWMLFKGQNIPQDVQEVFDVTLNARDKAIEFLRSRVKEGKDIRGYEVDQVAREYIKSRGYEKYIANRLGHSIGTFVHGIQTHLDNFENKDERLIVPNHLTSVEPCIIIPGKFGIRTEVDVLVIEKEVIVTTEIQTEIYKLP
jgi:Xaa-Pro dipeptidase